MKRSGFLVGAAAMTAAVVAAMAGDYTPGSKEQALKANTAQNVTNGQAVTVGGGFTVLTGIGAADTYTNVVTLANPGISGVLAVLVGGGGSNLVGLADSGNARLASAWTGDAGDTLTLVSTATTQWTEVARSNN